MTEAPLTHADLRQFTGDLERYRHTLNRRVIYTPGVRYLAEKAGAYWLIDEIALALASRPLQRLMARDERAREMLFWTLVVGPDESAILIASVDSGEPPVVRKRIGWTDFPLERIDIWSGFDGQHWTLYLPSEH